MNDDERWERDLRYYRAARHMRITHGEEVPPGTPNRRRLTEELHDFLHDNDLAGHAPDWEMH